MYCRKCGAEIGDAKYCPICGEKQAAAGEQGAFRDEAEERAHKYQPSALEPVPYNAGYTGPEYASQGSDAAGWIADKLRSVFRDQLFLVIAILMSVSCLAGSFVINASNGTVRISLGIITILFVIGLWLIYAQARRDDASFISGLSFTSGVVKAYKIVLWVVIVALFVGAVLCFVAGPALMRSFSIDGIEFLIGGDIMSDLPQDVIDEIPELINQDKFASFSSFLFIGLGIVMLVVDVVLLIVNLCYIKRLHVFTRSLCVSAKSGVYDVKNAVPSKNWLIVGAVFSIIGAVGSIGISGSATEIAGIRISTGGSVLGFISSACSAAAAVIASIMIKRHFVENN